MTAPTVGWIGLGAMGSPMARVTAQAGIPVTAFDLYQPALAAAEEYMPVASSAREAAAGKDVVALMVATGEQLDEVLFSDSGIAPELAPGTVVLVMATVGPQAIDAAATRLAGIGVGIVDAPVSGGVARARTGDLLMMVSGADEDVAHTQAVVDAMASNAPVVGSRPGDGQRFKIVNQLLCGVHIAAAGEALALATSMGLDIEQVYSVLGTGAAASFMFADRGRRMVDHAFDDVRSALDIFVKDMGLVAEAARDVGQPTPLATTAQHLYERGHRDGLGRKDDSIVYHILRGDFVTEESGAEAVSSRRADHN